MELVSSRKAPCHDEHPAANCYVVVAIWALQHYGSDWKGGHGPLCMCPSWRKAKGHGYEYQPWPSRSDRSTRESPGNTGDGERGSVPIPAMMDSGQPITPRKSSTSPTLMQSCDCLAMSCIHRAIWEVPRSRGMPHGAARGVAAPRLVAPPY